MYISINDIPEFKLVKGFSILNLDNKLVHSSIKDLNLNWGSKFFTLTLDESNFLTNRRK